MNMTNVINKNKIVTDRLEKIEKATQNYGKKKKK